MSPGAWRWFAWWMLSFLGFPAGGVLALVLVGSVEGIPSAALAGALAGAAIGAAQWLALRRRFEVHPLWVLATAVGLAVGDAVGAALTGAGTQIADLIVTGISCGVAVGLSQWAVLNRHVRGTGLWPLIVAVAWPVGWTVTWAIGVDVERGYAVFGSGGALVFTALTGLALLILTRGRA